LEDSVYPAEVDRTLSFMYDSLRIAKKNYIG